MTRLSAFVTDTPTPRPNAFGAMVTSVWEWA